MIGRVSARSVGARYTAAPIGVLVAVALFASLSACDTHSGDDGLPELHVYEQFDAGHREFESLVDDGNVDGFSYVELGGKSLILVTEPGNSLHFPSELPGDLEAILRIELPGSGPITPVAGDDYYLRFDPAGASVGLDLSEAGQDALIIRDDAGTVLAEEIITAAERRSAILRVVWRPSAGSIRAELYPPDASSETDGMTASMAVSATAATDTPTTITLTMNATADAPRALDWFTVYEYVR